MLNRRYNKSFKRHIMLFKRDLFIILIFFSAKYRKGNVSFFVSVLFLLFRFIFC